MCFSWKTYVKTKELGPVRDCHLCVHLSEANSCDRYRQRFCFDFWSFEFTTRLMVLDSLNLKLRQIATFSSNVTWDEMLSAKCSTRRKTTLPRTFANFSFHTFSCYETIIMVILLGGHLSLEVNVSRTKHEFCLVLFVVGMQKKIQWDEVVLISTQ